MEKCSNKRFVIKGIDFARIEFDHSYLISRHGLKCITLDLPIIFCACCSWNQSRKKNIDFILLNNCYELYQKLTDKVIPLKAKHRS